MQAAVHLKGALTMVSASPKSPVEVSAATVDALWIATSRRMLVIFLPFSRLTAAAALEFSTFAMDRCTRVARAVMLVQDERHRKIACTVLQQ